MPAGKTKEDTWKASELEKQVRGAREGSRGPSKRVTIQSEERGDEATRRSRHSDQNAGSRRNDGDTKKDRGDRHKSTDRDKHRDKDRDKDRDKERDREKDRQKDKEKDRDRHKDPDRHRERDKDREKHRERDKENEKSKDRDRDRDKDRHRDKDREKDRDKERDKDRDKDRDRHRDKDKDRDKHREKDKHRDGEKSRTSDPDKQRRKHQDDTGRAERKDKERDRDRDKSTGKHRSSRTNEEATRSSKHKSSDREKNKESHASREEKSKVKSSTGKSKEDDGGYDYDDDFEDYDDDFDEPSNDDASDDDKRSRSSSPANPWRSMPSDALKREKTEAELMMEAMRSENETMRKSQIMPNKHTSSRSQEKEEEEEENEGRSWKKMKNDSKATVTSSGFINFQSAKKQAVSQGASGRVAQRARDLLKIIERDVNVYEMYERHPDNEYDLFIRNFGSSNSKQVYVQTNEDVIERELQTDDIELRDKWTQYPHAGSVLPSGGDGSDENIDDKPLDSVALSSFLQRTGQVMCSVLEENSAEHIHKKVGHKQSNTVISEAFVEFGSTSLLEGRHVTHSQFSQSHNQLILSVYSTPHLNQVKDIWGSKGILCIWNVYEPHQPHSVLICESQPSCCCFSPYKSSLVFAGMMDGSLVVWDTRENSRLHHQYRDKEDNEYLLRHSTYDTAGVLNEENHRSRIVALSPVVSSSNGMSDNTTEESLTFQLASLETDSIVNIWVVIELSDSDVAGSQSDLGLSPGGRVKLVRSSSIRLDTLTRDLRLLGSFHCTDLQLMTSNNSQFFISTSNGYILHTIRYGGLGSPRLYRTNFDSMLSITSLDFSPFYDSVFLAGCSDGSLYLYHIESEQPLMTWLDSTRHECSVQLVRWCRSRPCVFFVLDDHSYLYIWDLQMDRNSAVKCEKISKSRVTSICLSEDHSATGQGLPGRSPQMVVCLDSGVVEAHIIKREFSALISDEIDYFNRLIKNST